MNILYGIGNYITWWFTIVTGSVLCCILTILYIVGWCFYIAIVIVLNIITAPISGLQFRLYGIPFEEELPPWMDDIFKAIQKYMGSRPFKKG